LTNTGFGLKYGSFVSTTGHLNLFSTIVGSTYTLNLRNGNNGNETALNFDGSANRNYTFPNTDGTLALTSNLTSLATTGSNSFVGNQSITGSGFLVHNLRTLSSANNSNYQLGNDTTANGAGIALFGSTYTTSGQYRQSGAYIYSNQAGGMTLHAEGANSMFLSTNGTTAITISSAQNTTFAGTITENSSIRYKENVETIKYGLDKVLQMRGVIYDKKDNGVKEMGVIAEEIYEVLPEVVLKNEEGDIDSVSYGRITAVLIEAIKDLKKEIEDLKANR
jgi:hypothetical protein